MNKLTLIYAIRLIIVGFIIFKIYQETGIFTALGFSLAYVFFELILQSIRQLSRVLKHFKYRTQK